MTINFQILPYTLHFKQPAGTSRGVYQTRRSWYILLWEKEHPLQMGIGECAPLPDLSCDAIADYGEVLTDFCRLLCDAASTYSPENIETVFGDTRLKTWGWKYPSMLFGLETALRHFCAGSFSLWDTPFSQGQRGITINGLVWMGKKEEMLRQIEQKMDRGFRCIKLKIGAIDFEEELALIAHIRARFSPAEIEIRVDANGAFLPDVAPEKLRRLSDFGLHSIEQPIRQGQWASMASLVRETPLPIALDEELIGVNLLKEKEALLDTIHPHYIILKPSLHGGLHGCREWIAEAEKRGIGWWITSALESNIGLNAIAQWCATLNPALPQGLGTGALFTDNIDIPLTVEGDRLWFRPPDRIPLQSYRTHRQEQILSLWGIPYPKTLALTLAHRELANKELPEWERDFFSFLVEWWDDSPTLAVQTSGSTGTPKTIEVEKERMMQSAITTCNALALKKGDKALLCLPVKYIAGKMMVVRALVAGLDLCPVAPSGNPLASISDAAFFDFAAMIPLQIINSLQNDNAKLGNIKNGIIGGASIDPKLEAEIASLPNSWYSTYGMTETLSHIALRRLNGTGKSEVYYPVPNVSVSLSDEETLVINAPSVCSEILVTKDIARIAPDGGFEILGRKDNVINSGGIKLQPEQIEQKLAQIVRRPLCITSLSDPKLGEKVVLLIESSKIEPALLLQQIASRLELYERPKLLLFTNRLPLTPNGKIDRSAARKLALLLAEKTE